MKTGIQTYYVINGKKYLDTLKKFELQHLMNTFQFPEEEVINVQNKKLYSLNVLRAFIEKIISKNERQNKSTFN